MLFSKSFSFTHVVSRISFFITIQWESIILLNRDCQYIS